MGWSFLAGVAVGAVVALVLMAFAQSTGRLPQWRAEDAARDKARKRRDDIETERHLAHDVADSITPEELSLVVAGRASIADIVRGRDDPGSPFHRARGPDGRYLPPGAT